MKNKKLKIIFGLFMAYGIWLMASVFVPVAKADTVTDNALNFLRSKQDADGKITTGFSAPSQWSAIAFTINNIDVANVKEIDKSLHEYLLTDNTPVNDVSTEWETRILAIVAIGQDPTNFGGINYLSHLEGFYNTNQIGDTCTLNDDIFGLLALIASGTASDTQKKQDVLNFLISKQDATDGGFGFSAPGCEFYGTSADMTGAAVEALVAAKENGLTNDGLDNAINRAKSYLLANQNGDGGFGYYGSSDTDTTGWVLQAFNVLGMKDSSEATAARSYLISRQSGTDGGILACNQWDPNTFACTGYASNATTTAQAVIALSGKGWVIKIYEPSATTSTSTENSSPSNNSSANNSPTQTPTPTAAPTATPTPTPVVLASKYSLDVNPTDTPEEEAIIDPTIAPDQEVLGSKTESKNNMGFAWFFAGLGMVFVFIYLAKTFIIKK